MLGNTPEHWPDAKERCEATLVAEQIVANNVLGKANPGMAYVHPDPGVRLVDSVLRTEFYFHGTENSCDDWIYHVEHGLLI